MIDELWGERPPATAAKALQVYVSQLRKLLEPERVPGAPGRLLESTPSGYRLRLAPGQLDLHRFEGLLEKGRRAGAGGEPGEAARLLAEALSLCGGAPLAELAYQPFAQTEITRLEELRLTALEERIEAELQLGCHAELVGELEALVSEHPLRERLRGRLMLALYRSGRQAEALEAYQQARRTLVEELGIEPGRALRELEQAILRQDPALDAIEDKAPVGKEPVGGGAGVFVGRERELGELRAGLGDALAGRGRLFLISGEPGIGKSRLTDELAKHAKDRGARVLVGRCWEAGGAPAYWPWVQALRSYLHGRDPELLGGQLGQGAADLAQILPELHDFFPDLRAPPSTDPDGARFRLFDATASFLRNASKDQPLVLVLDDLHAADTPSLLLFQFLASTLGENRLLVIGAYRDLDPTLRDPLSGTLAELSREPVTRRLPLTGLRESEVASFIEVTAGLAPPDRAAAAITRETEGNPLFVGEVVRMLEAEGRLAEVQDDAGWTFTVPEGVRAVIQRRLHGLSEECQRVLVLASVLGREFDVAALTRLSELAGEELLEVLDEALSERVVTDVPGIAGRLRFAHALIRDTLYEGLPAGRRLRLHREIGDALETLYAGNPEPHLAELAHHYFAAAPAGDPDPAIDYARRAGDNAAGLLAYEEAARLYEMALEALLYRESAQDEDETRCELLLALGDAQARAGSGQKARETFVEAAGIARQSGMAERFGEAALGYGGRFVWARSGTDPNLIPLLEEALSLVSEDDCSLRARLLARLAGALRGDPSPELRASISTQAVEMARRIGDPETLAYALDGRFAVFYLAEHPSERLAAATEVLFHAEELGDSERAFQAHDYRNSALVQLGDISTVDAELEEMARLAAELRQPAQLWVVSHTRAMRALLDGRFDEAEQLIHEALAFGDRALGQHALFTFRLQLFALRKEQGRLGEVEEMIERSADDFPRRPVFRCLLAALYGDLGRYDEARTIFEELAAGEFAGNDLDDEWLLPTSLLAELCAMLGDAPRAKILYTLLRPHAERAASLWAEVSLGSVARYLGILAAMTADFKAAEDYFGDALAMNERMGARPWLAHTQEDYAKMLLARGKPADRVRARELLDQALAAYRELGMESYADRISASRSGGTG